MVTVAKTECGAQSLSTNLRRTVQSLKELTGNPSDTEVYAALKECSMDANEAAQKLLNQGTSSQEASKAPKKFHLRKSLKIKANKKQKGKKNQHKSVPNASASDTMMV